MLLGFIDGAAWSKRLENVNRTHLVLASDMLLMQIKPHNIVLDKVSRDSVTRMYAMFWRQLSETMGVNTSRRPILFFILILQKCFDYHSWKKIGTVLEEKKMGMSTVKSFTTARLPDVLSPGCQTCYQSTIKSAIVGCSLMLPTVIELALSY